MSGLIKDSVITLDPPTINILGTPYKLIEQSEKENPKLEDACGLCEQYSKRIILADYLRDPADKMAVENPEEFRKKVLRHEIIHAFLGESGLRGESEWAENEEMVDWFSIQFEKIYRAFVEAGALEGNSEGIAQEDRLLRYDFGSAVPVITPFVDPLDKPIAVYTSTEVTQNE